MVSSDRTPPFLDPPQRATLRSQRRPATQGTKVSFIKCWWCRCFSPGRKKHPKEPYVLKGHVTSSHGPYWSTDWHGLDASPWGWQCETRHPLCATQSSDAVILTARAQMIFFISVPLGSDAFCKVLKKQIITQFKCGNHTSCTEPINSTRCSFYRGGEKN